jgi:hypothetical protein
MAYEQYAPSLNVTFILSNRSTLFFCSKDWINSTDASIEQPVALHILIYCQYNKPVVF